MSAVEHGACFCVFLYAHRGKCSSNKMSGTGSSLSSANRDGGLTSGVRPGDTIHCRHIHWIYR